MTEKELVELMLDNLIPEKELVRKDIIQMYNSSLSILNDIKTSRFQAAMFGSMSVGPDMYEWKDDKQFFQKYLSCCKYVLSELSQRENKSGIIDVCISILYSMLSQYITYNDIDVSDKTEELLAINDTFSSGEN